MTLLAPSKTDTRSI